MNSQLYAHLETFDSDEEYSDDASLDEDYDDISDVVVTSTNGKRIHKSRLRTFVKPRNINDIFLKALTLVPVGIALGDYFGLLRSITLSVACFVLLQLRPPPLRPSVRQDRPRVRLSSRSSSTALRMSRRGSSRASSSHGSRGSFYGERRDSATHRTKRKSKVSDAAMSQLEMVKKQVHDCRKEVSRLLGLVGAPPMEWKQFDDTRMNDIIGNAPAEGGEQEHVPSTARVDISDLATTSLVKFLEAHVQFLLTIDHAYYWMKVSASLHLGLGPQSQCVERVERAAVAKEFRNGRRRSITTLLIQEGISSPLEAQRKVDSSSILSLSSARRHLAQAMVDQSESLVGVYRTILMETEILKREENREDDPNAVIDQDVVLRSMERNILEMPHVIDLAWMKESRRHLASLLGQCVDEFCTVDCLRTLSEKLAPRSKLDESMWNARNAREHLICNLLLGKESSARPFGTSTPKSDEELMLSLLQYRQQLNALGAAVWSCQHYAHDTAFGASVTRNSQSCTTNSINNAPTAAEILQQEEDVESEKVAWWIQVKEMGAACRALEKEIEDKHFAYVMVDATAKVGVVSEVDDANLGGNVEQLAVVTESGNYEHGVDYDGRSRTQPSVAVSTNKVLVFSGKGSVDKGHMSSSDQTAVSWTHSEIRGESSTMAPTTLPERDTVAEQLLVRELQNRIRTMALLEEQEQMDALDEERITISMDMASVRKTGTGTGNRELFNVKDQTTETIDTIEGSISGSSSSSSRELETATSMFLGATGALLGELKRSIPPVQDDCYDLSDDAAFTDD